MSIKNEMSERLFTIPQREFNENIMMGCRRMCANTKLQIRIPDSVTDATRLSIASPGITYWGKSMIETVLFFMVK